MFTTPNTVIQPILSSKKKKKNCYKSLKFTWFTSYKIFFITFKVMAMSYSHQYIFWLYLIYSGITALVTVVANICLQVILLARRTMSLVHDFIITVSIFRASEGVWFHSTGNTDYVPVIYAVWSKRRCICILILNNCLKEKSVRLKPIYK